MNHHNLNKRDKHFPNLKDLKTTNSKYQILQKSKAATTHIRQTPGSIRQAWLVLRGPVSLKQFLL